MHTAKMGGCFDRQISHINSLIMTTTSHGMCRISLKELPLHISRDSKTEDSNRGNHIHYP